MSGITYTFDLASSQASAPSSSPAMGSGDAAALERSYLSASAPREVAASSPVGDGAGPGLTTLALGEEDGGGMGAAPQPGGMSTPAPGGDYQVTTLAIGEEDGGGATSAPISDDHSMIGGHSVSAVGHGDLADGYGEMQPIYSPGETEYPAFVETSQTTDILNFHPVPRSFAETVQQSIQPAPMTGGASATTMAPIGNDSMQATPPMPAAPATMQPVYATAEATPVTMDPAPVSSGGGDLSGDYVSVGSYEAYVSATSGGATVAPVEAVASEPVYDQFQPAADMTAYDSATPVDAPAAAVAAPETSAEPAAKPGLFEKDAPLDYAGTEQAADPADGRPDYVAPAEAPNALAPKADATYVTVPLDAYLVDPSGTAPTATGAAPDAAPATDAESPAPAETSMGGSFTVIDAAMPETVSGETSGMKAPEAAATEAETSETATPSSAKDDLTITTLAIGEEDGGGS